MNQNLSALAIPNGMNEPERIISDEKWAEYRFDQIKQWCIKERKAETETDK